MTDGTYKAKKRRNVYIALEDMEFFWTKEEVTQVINLWNNGCSLRFIELQTNRLEDEIALLIISINSHNKIFFERDFNANKNSNSVKLPHGYNTLFNRFIAASLKDGYLLFSRTETVDFIWDEDQVKVFQDLWNTGVGLKEMKKKLKRKSIVDLVILAIDRCQKGYISPRKEGLEGFIDGSPVRSGSKRKQKNKTA